MSKSGLSGRRSPVLFLAAVVLLNCMALLWMGWRAHHYDDSSRVAYERTRRSEELRGIIVYLDEVLTMSARMAAATGDSQWEERYRNYEPKLDAAIKEAIELIPEGHSAKAAAKTDVANIKLVEMENRAFDLVRQGRTDEANVVLFSELYETQKQIYAAGMTEFDAALSDISRAAWKQHRRHVFLEITVGASPIPLMVVGWIVVFRVTRKWEATLKENHRRLAQQAEQLSELNRSLDQKVMERTVELAEANEELKMEITIREQAEEALRTSEEYQRITLGSIGDGVIVTGVDQNVTLLNKAAEALTGWTPEEACGRPLEEVFDIINEETRAAADDPVTRVIATGRIPGLANHTVLICRDKTERAIADSAAPIHDASGEIVGVVLVFRDVTVERDREKEKEQLLHALGERVKELNCLYGLSKIVERSGITLEEIFQETVELIPPGW